MMSHIEFDGDILSEFQLRWRVIRILNVSSHAAELTRRQKGMCPLCNHELSSSVQVDHTVTVDWFARHTEIPLTEAYLRCHDINNLRVVCRTCHPTRGNDQQRERAILEQVEATKRGDKKELAYLEQLKSAMCIGR